jgi:hypothetical protein
LELPYGEEIVSTLTALDAFLGAVLGISSASYKKISKNTEVNGGDADV